MFGVTIRCPGSPSLDTLGPILESLTEANARWYLAQWEVGRRPPTTCAAAGVRYKSHPMGSHSTWCGASEILERPRKGWSCQECAALDAGAARAAALWNGVSPEQARAAYRCVLEVNGPNDYHALVSTPEGYENTAGGLVAA